MASKSSATLIPTHPTAQRLLAAAMKSMDAEGEAGLRVDAVVAEAGVTIPVLYHHFGSREGLVRAAHIMRIRRSLEFIIAHLEVTLAGAEDREAFRQIIEWILDRVSAPSEERFIRLNVLGATYGRPDLQAEVAEIQLEVWERIAELFREPQEKGWIRADLDLQTCIGWMLGLFLSRALIDIQSDTVHDSAWDRCTREAIHTVLFGEAPNGPT
jgi:AcrR family transcriptional regulator